MNVPPKRSFRTDWHSRERVTSRLRLRGHDHASASVYFVTICVQGRQCLFGIIDNDAVEHSVAGLMVESWWHFLPQRFPGIAMDAAIVMPNHLDGIVHIGTDPTLDRNQTFDSILGWYKSITSHDYGIGVRNHGFEPYERRLWQKGYYKRILRDEQALERARDYTAGNPLKWEDDDENPFRDHDKP